MIQKIYPGNRYGTITAPASKSIAHRALICAALAEDTSTIRCSEISKDIQATMNCLQGLGAGIRREKDRILTDPVLHPHRDQETSEQAVNTGAELQGHTGTSGQTADSEVHLQMAAAGQEYVILPCSESGSTLRFLIPVAGALGIPAAFQMEGRLPQRPMDLYEAVLREHGMSIRREENTLYCSGQLQPGAYCMPGNISSQYFTGLLFALPMLSDDSILRSEGLMESADYVRLTESQLMKAGIVWTEIPEGYQIPGRQHYHAPKELVIEGDYSNGAFFLCMGAFSPKGITVQDLSAGSLQGDRRITDVLRRFGARVVIREHSVSVSRKQLQGIEIDASMIPDLIPVLSVVAAGCRGTTRIYNGQRLRMKESDRIQSTASLLKALGARVKETEDGMIIQGQESLEGGVSVDSCNDHRIAMSAAVAACICRKPVTILDAECVEKSFPDFWKVFASLQRAVD